VEFGLKGTGSGRYSPVMQRLFFLFSTFFQGVFAVKPAKENRDPAQPLFQFSS
jgi:hypothetical protein